MPHSPRHPLRLVGKDGSVPEQVASHRSRNGSTYYLHEGVTKTGKPRFFVRKSIGDGARAEMPDGFEFHESVNGVVSVRRIRGPSPIPAADLDLVAAELARHPHLARYLAEISDTAILVFEPQDAGMVRNPDIMSSPLQDLIRELGLQPIAAARPATRYDPVMRFELSSATPGCYSLHRMTYRGSGGWLFIEEGPLRQLSQHLRVLGTDAFFELF